MKVVFFVFSFFLLLTHPCAYAWNDHAYLTKNIFLNTSLTKQKYGYQDLKNCLPPQGNGSIDSPQKLGEYLKINASKVNWMWGKNRPESISVIDILSYSAQEVDAGMDQNMNLSPVQKYMGGFTGESSQGFRHMYFPGWSVKEPLGTLHYPLYEMGEAPDRAQLFFDLAVSAYKAKCGFWSFRFLGWGMHYVEDIMQPYHTNQLASLSIFPIATLANGWTAFVNETTRIVGNYHLSMEQYTDFFLLNSVEKNNLHRAFQIPEPITNMHEYMKMDYPIARVMRSLAVLSGSIAPKLVSAQQNIFGQMLHEPNLNLIAGWLDEKRKPKIDFKRFEAREFDSERAPIVISIFKALSNTTVATHWYLDKFVAETH